MNNEKIDHQVPNVRYRDDPSAAKVRQSKTLGSRVARFLARTSPKTVADKTKSVWVCTVCSHQNVNSDDDRCFRCQFFREKPELSKHVALGKGERPGAYEVVDKHQQLRPIHCGGSYLLKANCQPKSESTERIQTWPPATESLDHSRPPCLFSSDNPTTCTANATTGSASNTLRDALPTYSSMSSRKTSDGENDEHDVLQMSERSMPFTELCASSNVSDPDLNGGSSPPAEKATFAYQMQTSYGGWSDTDRESWQCNICTYRNDNALHLICTVCGNRRDALSETDASNQSSVENLDRIKSKAEENRVEEELKRLRMNELIMMQYELMSELTNARISSTDDSKERKSIDRQASMEQISRQMSELVGIHADDCKQHRQSTKLRDQRNRSLIEDENRVNLSDCIEESEVQSQSDRRDQMLNQWQLELNLNQKKIQELQRHQEELIRAIDKDRSGR